MWFAGVLLAVEYGTTRPRVPRPDTGNVYALNNHGSVTYLTLNECIRVYGLMALGFGGFIVLWIVNLQRNGWVVSRPSGAREAERYHVAIRMLLLMVMAGILLWVFGRVVF